MTNYGLWVILMCLCMSILGNKHVILVSDAGNGTGHVCV